MFTTFWDKIAEGLAGEWNLRTFAPALAFWGGGLMAWVWQFGWDRLNAFLSKVDASLGVALAVAGLYLLVVSTTLVQWAALPVLRWSEGYWPVPLRRLRFALAKRESEKANVKEKKWDALAKQFPGGLNAEQLEEYANLDTQLAAFPVNPARYLPTRLGNLLSAAEEYPKVRYGLDISTTWPRLWLVLPESTQKELGRSRELLDKRVELMIWGLLFVIWTVWAWWALPIALIVALAAYWGMLEAAGVYAQLLRATFDIYRFKLYESLSLEQPTDAKSELTWGGGVTKYLHRGEVTETLKIRAPDRDDKKRDGREE